MDDVKSVTKSKSSDVVKNDAGDPVRDFTTFAEADAQAKALGNAHVEHVGTAFHVADDE